MQSSFWWGGGGKKIKCGARGARAAREHGKGQRYDFFL